jgi:hypothetical protein
MNEMGPKVMKSAAPHLYDDQVPSLGQITLRSDVGPPDAAPFITSL